MWNASLHGTRNAQRVILASHSRYRLKYNTKAELWSLGILIYALLVGKIPFTCSNPHLMLTNITKNMICVHYKLEGLKLSSVCKDLIKQLLTIDPKKRIDKLKFFAHPFVKNSPSKYRQLYPSLATSCKLLADKDELKENTSSEGTVFYRSSSDNTSLASSHASSPKSESFYDDTPKMPNKV